MLELTADELFAVGCAIDKAWENGGIRKAELAYNLLRASEKLNAEWDIQRRMVIRAGSPENAARVAERIVDELGKNGGGDEHETAAAADAPVEAASI